MSLVLILVLPVSGFASVSTRGCQDHSDSPANAAYQHDGAQMVVADAAEAVHHSHHPTGDPHVDHKAGRDAYCHCAGALALALFAQLPADFDLQLSLAFAVSEQSHLGNVQRGAPYRPPIHATV